MPDPVSRDALDERPLAPLAWTRRRVLGTGLVAAGTLALTRVEAASARPRRPGPSPSRDLDRAITDLMALGKLPGVSAAVVRGDEVVWARGYGYANLRQDEAVRPSTLFMLASISKTPTASDERETIELDNPYKGLRPFREGDEQDFHGRCRPTRSPSRRSRA